MSSTSGSGLSPLTQPQFYQLPPEDAPVSTPAVEPVSNEGVQSTDVRAAVDDTISPDATAAQRQTAYEELQAYVDRAAQGGDYEVIDDASMRSLAIDVQRRESIPTIYRSEVIDAVNGEIAPDATPQQRLEAYRTTQAYVDRVGGIGDAGIVEEALPARTAALLDEAGIPRNDAAFREGQQFGQDLQAAANDPARIEQLFVENADRLDDPDFAAGAISEYPPETLRAIPGSYSDAADNIRVTERLSDLLGTATHSDRLSQQWIDGFFGGMKESALNRWGAGQLMRTGDFDTEFLVRATRDVVLASRDDDASVIPVTWSLDDSSIPDSGNEWILGAVSRNPEASSVVASAFAQELVNESSPSEAVQVGEIIRAGTIEYRATDPAQAEYATRQVLAAVDEADGKVPLTLEDALADVAVEYIDDIAYAANSPVDIPLDAQDSTRPGIEMPFETARDLLYAAGGMEHNQAKLFVAAAQWQDELSQQYGGDPNLQAAYGREVGGFQSLVRGATAARLIDDGRTVDENNAQAREGFDTVVGLIESKGASVTGIVKDLALGWAKDTLIPETQAEAEAQRDYVDQTFTARREAFRDAGNYLLVNPENLRAFNLGQNPPRTVDIHPQGTIEQVQEEVWNQQVASGIYAPVDADFTEPDGRGGLRIKAVEEMSSTERAAYVRWVSDPEVRQVLLSQVDSQNQADDDTAPGTGGG